MDLPIKNGDFPWLCKRLPEGKPGGKKQNLGGRNMGRSDDSFMSIIERIPKWRDVVPKHGFESKSRLNAFGNHGIVTGFKHKER